MAFDGQGQSACSIQWGAWAGSGMAGSAPDLAARLKRAGLNLVVPQVGLGALGIVPTLPFFAIHPDNTFGAKP